MRKKTLKGRASSSACSQNCHILVVIKPSLYVAHNFAKLTPKDNIFHIDSVTLENISTSCLLFLKDRNASILQAGMACYHLPENAFSWPNWKTLWGKKKKNHYFNYFRTVLVKIASTFKNSFLAWTLWKFYLINFILTPTKDMMGTKLRKEWPGSISKIFSQKSASFQGCCQVL